MKKNKIAEYDKDEKEQIAVKSLSLHIITHAGIVLSTWWFTALRGSPQMQLCWQIQHLQV